jgi:hypothetical protein
MQDFPSNSQKAKAPDAPREELKPVTSAQARERKNGIGRKFKRTFFAGSGKDAVHLMVEDHIVPSIQDMLSNALKGGIDALFFGDRANRRRTTASSITNPAATGTRVDYAGLSTGAPTRATQQARTLSRQARAQHNLADLVIPTRSEAESVIDRMYDIMSRDGMVTVADLYVLTNVRPDMTDVKWGWTNLRGARAVGNERRGYMLSLPEPEALG